MSTIAENLAALQQAKADIAEAITTKGGTVGSGDGFSDFATDIGTIPTGGSPSLEDKTVPLDMASGNQVVTATQGYDGLSRVTVAKPATLDPSNIKDGVNIGGVVGTYAPSSATLVTKTITQNGTYNASSDNADGYSQVTVNVSGGGATGDDVIFIDYDGTVLHSYSKAAFLALSAMPANPSHTGMVAQGWNWTLAQAQAYVTSYDKLIIGQLYNTASGYTEYDIVLTQDTGLTVGLYLKGEDMMGNLIAENETIDWGDGTTSVESGGNYITHTYALAGTYTIKLRYLDSGIWAKSQPIIRNIRWGSRDDQNIGWEMNFGTFAGCETLETISFPSRAIWITENAFQNCYSLKAVVLPQGSNIGSYGFDSCRTLQYFSFGYGLQTIEGNAFICCYSLKYAYVAGVDVWGEAFRESGVEAATIGKANATLGGAIFYNCQSLRNAKVYEITDTVHVYSLFEGCSSLSEIILPSGLTRIGSKFCKACFSLTKIQLPSSLTSIEYDAFSGCNALQELTLPNNLLTIGSYAFAYCTGLRFTLTIPSFVTEIASSAFTGVLYIFTLKMLSSTPPTLGDTSALPSQLEKIEIPSGSLSAYQNATNWSAFSSKFVEV